MAGERVRALMSSARLVLLVGALALAAATPAWGASWSDPQAIPTDQSLPDAWSHNVALATGGGRAIAAWNEGSGMASETTTHYMLRGTDGTWGSTVTSTQSFVAGVAMGSGGDAVVMTQETTALRARFIAAGGTSADSHTFGSDVRWGAHVWGEHRSTSSPFIAINESGAVAAVGYSAPGPGRVPLLLTRFGETWEEETIPVPGDVDASQEPDGALAVGIDSAGAVTVLLGFSYGVTLDFPMYAVRRTPGGTWEEPQRLTSFWDGGGMREASMRVGSSGAAIAQWQPSIEGDSGLAERGSDGVWRPVPQPSASAPYVYLGDEGRATAWDTSGNGFFERPAGGPWVESDPIPLQTNESVQAIRVDSSGHAVALTHVPGCHDAATGYHCSQALAREHPSGGDWSDAVTLTPADKKGQGTGIELGAGGPAAVSVGWRNDTADEDGLFHPARAVRTLDIAALPVPVIVDHPAERTRSTVAEFSFGSLDTDVTFECRIDGGEFTACESPKSYTELGEASHTFQVRSKRDGETGNAGSWTWTVDTTPPDTVISAEPPASTNSTSATFGFSAVPPSGATFECSLDGADFTPCEVSDDYDSLGEGSHSFEVRAVDDVGNVDASPARSEWTVDLTAPGTELTSQATAGTGATFAFAGVPTAGTSGFECSLDQATFTACTSPRTYSGLAAGAHEFRVRARDQAGNVDGSPATAAWTVEQTPGDPATDGGDPGAGDTGGDITDSEVCPIQRSRTATIAAGCAKKPPPCRTLQDALGHVVQYAPVEAIGCGLRTTDQKVWRSSAAVRVNGIDMFPTAGEIVFDSRKRTVTGEVVMVVGGRFGDPATGIPLWAGKINWDFSLAHKFELFAPTKKRAAFGGLEFAGQAPLADFSTGPEAGDGKTAFNFEFDLGEKFHNLTWSVSASTTNQFGFGMKVGEKLPLVKLGHLQLRDVSLSLDTTEWVFEMSGGVVIPGPDPALMFLQPVVSGTVTWKNLLRYRKDQPDLVEISADAAFAAIPPTSISLKVDGLNKPLIGLTPPTIFLQRLAGTINIPARDEFAGLAVGAGVSFGPSFMEQNARHELASLDGTVTFKFDDPGTASLDGVLKLLNFELSSGHVDWSTWGDWNWNGNLTFPSGQLALLIPYQVRGAIHGFYDWKRKLFNGVGRGEFIIRKLVGTSTHTADMVASNKGLIACVSTTAGGARAAAAKKKTTKPQLKPTSAGPAVGFSYIWETKKFQPMLNSCDVGPWKVARPASRAAASTDARTLTLPGGLPLTVFGVVGMDGPPRVTLTGPGGEKVTAGPGAAVKEGPFFALPGSGDNTTYIAVERPAAGVWTITPEGGAAVTDVRQAEALPTPDVKARITGTGRRRTLNYEVKPIPGQTVTFYEQGTNVRRVLGTTAKRRGTLRFEPTVAPAGMRDVVAQVEQGGLPRAVYTVATYRAPGPPRPATPRRVSMTHRGNGLTIRWRPVSGATRYLATVTLGDGRKLLLPATGRNPGVKVAGVSRRTRVRAEVVAIDDRSGRSSRPARANRGRNGRREHGRTAS